VYCSEEFAEICHPPVPLRHRVYNCGRRFETSVVEDGLQAEQSSCVGLIAIDGNEASLGTVHGLAGAAVPTVTSLHHMESVIHSRHRKGGQSQSRFSNLRDEAEMAFLRQVAERADMVFPDVEHIVVAGKANLKRKLLPELPQRLGARVLCVVDLPCSAGPACLRQVAHRAREVAQVAENRIAEAAVERFMELAVGAGDEAYCCYGLRQTEMALELGAVEMLFVSFSSPEVERLKALAALHDAEVVEVAPRTEVTEQFCTGYSVGACLRWALDFDLLEGDGLVEDGVSEEDALADDLAPEDDAGDAVRWVGQAAQEGLSVWVRERLQEALGDAASAEALAVCVEVLVPDSIEEVEPMLVQEGVPQGVAALVAHHCSQVSEQ